MEAEVEKLLRKAIAELRSGNADEALLILERTVDPKFESIGDASIAMLDHRLLSKKKRA
jgi:hypothetical protein